MAYNSHIVNNEDYINSTWEGAKLPRTTHYKTAVANANTKKKGKKIFLGTKRT